MTDHLDPAAESAASAGTPAGWYEDPKDPTRFRWWDGQAWTRKVSTEPLGSETSGSLASGASIPAGGPEDVVPRASWEALETAQSVLELTGKDEARAPRIIPRADGGVRFLWTIDGVPAVLEAGPDGALENFAVGSSAKTTGPVMNDADEETAVEAVAAAATNVAAGHGDAGEGDIEPGVVGDKVPDGVGNGTLGDASDEALLGTVMSEGPAVDVDVDVDAVTGSSSTPAGDEQLQGLRHKRSYTFWYAWEMYKRHLLVLLVLIVGVAGFFIVRSVRSTPDEAERPVPMVQALAQAEIADMGAPSRVITLRPTDYECCTADGHTEVGSKARASVTINTTFLATYAGWLEANRFTSDNCSVEALLNDPKTAAKQTPSCGNTDTPGTFAVVATKDVPTQNLTCMSTLLVPLTSSSSDPDSGVLEVTCFDLLKKPSGH